VIVCADPGRLRRLCEDKRRMLIVVPLFNKNEPTAKTEFFVQIAPDFQE